MKVKLKIDPEFHALISPLEANEREELEKSIKQYGCYSAITCWNEIIIDGHNRYEICRKNNYPFSVAKVQFESREKAIEYIITNQLARRNITAYQRLALIERRASLYAADAKKAQRDHGGTAPGKPKTLIQKSGEVSNYSNRTDYKIGKEAGVSHDTVYKAKILRSLASDEVKGQLVSGQTNINREYNKLKRYGVAPCRKPQRLNVPEKIVKIRELAAKGFRADQIGEKLGITGDHVRILAKKAAIVLPDALVRNRKALDVNRIISETVIQAQALTAGLELIESRSKSIDVSKVDDWIERLNQTIRAISTLIKTLRRIPNEQKQTA